MPNIGKIDEFYPDVDDWETYIERLDLYCGVNDIAAERKAAVLLTSMGGKAYKKIRLLCSPDLPNDKTFAQLKTLMRDRGAAPKPTQIAARFNFQSRKQKPQESVSDFHLSLKELAEDCKFAANLEDRLRDQIVSGLHNKRVQEELLARKDLSYTEALEFALSRETALKDSDAIGASCSAPAAASVSMVKARYPKSVKSHSKLPKCSHCGRTNHTSDKCFYRDATCNLCNQIGHIKPVCPKSKHSPGKPGHKKKQFKVHTLEGDYESSDELPMHGLDCKIYSHKVQPFQVKVKVASTDIMMEVDTGATVSVMNRTDYENLQSKPPLRNTDIVLSTYTRESLRPIGMCTVEVEYNDQVAELDLYVLDNTNSPPLLGRSWLKDIKLDWNSIKVLQQQPSNSSLQPDILQLLHKHKDLFNDEIGTLRGIKAKINVKADANPKFMKSRPVPLSLQKKVNDQIDRLVDRGVLSPVTTSDWATPIVPILKGDNTVRICGDFKVTVNPVLNVETYPQPRREDLFARLAGGVTFSKIDLASAYLQMEVDEESKKYLTINTMRGLFQYNRLVFGIASAPAIFQRAIESIVRGMDDLLVYQDDILVTGKTAQEHFDTLAEVLMRLEAAGLRLKKNKCLFFVPELVYLGHKIDKTGIHTVSSKVAAIVDAPIPQNVSELRSFLGTVNYYGQFIPNLSTIIAPLNNLLRSNIDWSWTTKANQAFTDVKHCLTRAPVLAHYDPELPLVVACDASPFGIAAVLSHRFDDSSERPIAYASRALTDAEKNYAQIDREALAIIFGIKKFHEYIYGRKFVLVTDNRPLTHIFSENKCVPTMSAARIQRWALYLGGHNYTIEFRPSAKHTNVDGLSRLPLPEYPTRTGNDEHELFLLNQIEVLPISSADIALETRKDPLLSLVYQHTLHGWESYTGDNNTLKPFFSRRDEISIQSNCLLWGIRVIIPTKYQDQVLNEIHSGHLGMAKMKAVARGYVYWPNIDQNIEQKVKGCRGCTSVSKMPTPAPLHPWEWPSRPWKRLHIDFAGPFLDQMFMILVDAHSKWPEVIRMSKATSSTTINALRSIFARFGMPDQIVSDNGAQFCSAEFEMEFATLESHHTIHQAMDLLRASYIHSNML